MKRLLWGALWVLGCGPLAAQAMNVRIEGERAFVSGEVDYPDNRRLADAFEHGVKVVVLQDIGGGRIDALRAVGDRIAKGKASTVAVGVCNSACAWLFVRGKQRYFAETAAGQSPAMLHVMGASFTGDRSGPATRPQIYAYFRKSLTDAVSARLLSRYTTEWTQGKALVFIGPSEKAAEGAVIECSDLNARPEPACMPVDGLTPLSAGLLTSITPYKL